MAKIDDVLQQLATHFKRAMGGRQIGGKELTPTEAKQALYTDMLELIGEDEPFRMEWCGKNVEIDDRNKLRQELRNKLKEYYGISDD